MCIQNKIGPPVEGENFFGREAELAKANRLLESNHSLLLSAPRRIGKSSLAKRLIADCGQKGWKNVYADLEETTTEEGFLRMMIDAFAKNGIWRQISDGMSQGMKSVLGWIDKVSIGHGAIDINLSKPEDQENLYQILKEVLRHDENTLIVVDELTIFLNALVKSEGGIEKVSFILNWLRSLRQVSQTKIRWLFCGSAGLRNFTAALNLGFTINDLTEFHLDELSRKEAQGLMRGLCAGEGIDMTDEAISYSLDKLYWNIPYFIQILFSKLSEDYVSGTVSMLDIDRAYNKLLSETYLGTWSERLAEYNEFEFPARKILNALAVRPAGLKRTTLLSVLMSGRDASESDRTDLELSRVLGMLENDGYLLKRESVRAFRSPLLRDYWKNRFVQ